MTESTLQKLENYFGISSKEFNRLELVRIGDDVYITTKEAADFSEFKVYRRGIKLAQIFPNSIKYATGAIQLFGKFATKNTIQLNYSESFMFAQGQEFTPRAQPSENNEGFVIAKYKQFPIGIGNYKDGKLKSSIPRTQVVRLGLRKRKSKHKR